jgi:hypothetical protein
MERKARGELETEMSCTPTYFPTINANKKKKEGVIGET